MRTQTFNTTADDSALGELPTDTLTHRVLVELTRIVTENFSRLITLQCIFSISKCIFGIASQIGKKLC